MKFRNNFACNTYIIGEDARRLRADKNMVQRTSVRGTRQTGGMEMGWKESKGAGFIAVILVVVGIVAVVLFMRSGTPPVGGSMTFECADSGQTFKITDADMENDPSLHAEYMGKAGQAVKCKLDDKNDAYWVYYCPVDKKYFKYEPKQAERDTVKCPNGHEIPAENW
jgi:hypothetical protein